MEIEHHLNGKDSPLPHRRINIYENDTKCDNKMNDDFKSKT